MTGFSSLKSQTPGNTAHSQTYSCFAQGTAFRDKTAGRMETSVLLCKEGVKTPSCRQRGIYGCNFFVGHIRGLGKNLRGTDPGGTGNYEATTPLFAFAACASAIGSLAALRWL